jgi:outer membrane protein assembly factor BamB
MLALASPSARDQASGTAALADWLTDGGDAQRTGWQRNEHLLGTATVKNMRLLWTYQTDNESRQMHALLPPLIVGRVTTPAGPQQVVVVAGVSDNLYALSADRGELIWKKHFDGDDAGGRGSLLCPGGQTATPVIAPASSAGKYTLYAASSDGRLRQVDVATGSDAAPPELFMPPNGKPYALNYSDGVVYTTTAQGCGGNPNVMYGFDLATRKVGVYSPASGGMWGHRGPSIGTDGTVYAGTGDGNFDPANQIYGQAIIGVKQNPATKALELKDYYGPPNADFMRERDLDMNVTGPVFTWNGREYTVQSSKECRLWLLDTSSLGGADHRTAKYRSPLVCNDDLSFSFGGWSAISTAVDPAGARWIYMPFWGPKSAAYHAPVEHGQIAHGAVAALKVESLAGKPRLTPVWLSGDIDQAEPPVIANGVVFAFGSGEFGQQATPELGARFNTAANRIARSGHAVIHALDAETGNELWSSGDQVKSFNHWSGMSVANGHVYVGTFDGVVYCFGLEGQ